MPSSALSSISISISGDDSDEPAGKSQSRLRARRRRWKPPIHVRQQLCYRMARALVRWWPVLLFLPAVVLLAFEASRISGKADDDLKREEVVREEEVRGNLNRLDPITRVVNGVREPCLKISRPEKIQNLEFPADTEPSFSVKEVLYKSDSGTSFTGGHATLSFQYTEHARFNLFTGNQTLQEREESFKVNETLQVHCGFYSDIGGFRISDFDKSYMQTCKAVVSTCAFGGGDDLYQPVGMTDASLRKVISQHAIPCVVFHAYALCLRTMAQMQVCYVAFWDEITLSAQETDGKKLGDNHMIGKWRIVIVRDLPFSDQRLNGKIPKMLSHRLFPQARYSIWVDSKSQFRRDPLGVLEVFLWRTNSVLAISEHGARSSVFDEGKAVVKKHKASPEEVKIQLTQYRKDGLREVKRFGGKKALAEASIIVREHTPQTNLFMCLWFNEVVRFTSRDQLSFPYVLWRLNIPGINMFPVCARKDLVNSMGHKRKVKPLVRTRR